MKVMLLGEESKALEHRLLDDGEEVVKSAPELIISDKALESPSCPVVGERFSFPPEALELFGLELTHSPPQPKDILVARWYESGDWSPQTIIGIPLVGLMNENLGPLVDVGLAMRYVHESSLSDLLEAPKLSDTLSSMRHNGFVSARCSLQPGKNQPVLVQSIQCGFPSYGLFTALEGVKGRVIDFFTSMDTRLLESWAVGLLISVPPFPSGELSAPALLCGISGNQWKHCWFFDLRRGKDGRTFTGSEKVGVITAWGSSLREASGRVLRTARNLQLREKQFRTDVEQVVGKVWAEVKGRGLVVT